MTVQIIEVAGNRMAVLPEDEYRQLLDAVEDRGDRDAAVEAERRRLAGEEYIPVSVMDRLLAGESPVKVWRQYRGLTQGELASRIGVTNMSVSNLERGSRGAKMQVWRALSEALDVPLEDILPEDRP
ncbi:helix-turn-helix transcriptional regulator [Hephaestia mangrovi]|uniref:helix-turn-helix transcriptional regulator n=1 Tax=Hephaestia mangrovi TaxID=2873268 RepID=UPI001CA6A837|nr:helix-turn-helix transcriptional regulator [Hephaestia mangrovi]MBY8828437.1 helix-turn-helix transcriptional regulator [Hephaestia mangrovi]